MAGQVLLLTRLPFDEERLSAEDEAKLARLDGPLDEEDPFVVAFVRAHVLQPPSTAPYSLETRSDVYLAFKVS